MTPDFINKRLEELAALENQHKAIVANSQNMLMQIEGARQDCYYWLTKIAEEAARQASLQDTAQSVTSALPVEAANSNSSADSVAVDVETKDE